MAKTVKDEEPVKKPVAEDLSLVFTVQPGQWIVQADKTYQPGDRVTYTEEDVNNLSVADLVSRGIIK